MLVGFQRLVGKIGSLTLFRLSVIQWRKGRLTSQLSGQRSLLLCKLCMHHQTRGMAATKTATYVHKQADTRAQQQLSQLMDRFVVGHRRCLTLVSIGQALIAVMPKRARARRSAKWSGFAVRAAVDLIQAALGQNLGLC